MVIVGGGGSHVSILGYNLDGVKIERQNFLYNEFTAVKTT